VPAPGDPYDAPLLPLYEHALAAAGTELDYFDAHTHLGHNDPDGYHATAEEIVAGLDRAGQRRALIFPMHEPDGYRAANAEAIDAMRRHPGRLTALARINPHDGREALAEAERCLAAGAVGFKLHPRSDAFDLPDAVVDGVVALAHEARAPVLFHAGRGFPGLGEEVVSLSRRYPDARLILAHAGISDLGHLGPLVAEAPNLFFDTAWWLVSDLLTLYATVPPGQILYASDMPYGNGRFHGSAFLRCALTVGLDGEALRSIAGEQLDRIARGEDAVDLGPAPGMGVLGARDLIMERGIAYLAAACQIGFRGGDPTEPLALARLAFRPAPDAVIAYVDRLVADAEAQLPIAEERRQALLFPLMAAQLVLGTPSVGVPDLF
jgi:predicted TIM-barrel fold metal-dependent hydrolase